MNLLFLLMLVIKGNDYKAREISFIDINKYNDSIRKLKPYSLKCSCGCRGSLIKYGRYKRRIDNYDILIQRVYCKNCKVTHALLPIFIIPYERNSICCVMDMINCDIICKADYELIRYKNIYNEWIKKMNIKGINNCDGLELIITFCANRYNMGFMQSKLRLNRNGKIVDYCVENLPT